MEGSPEGLSSEDIQHSAEEINGVKEVHHIHVWSIDEHRIAMEAHVVVTTNKLKEVEVIKVELKQQLHSSSLKYPS